MADQIITQPTKKPGALPSQQPAAQESFASVNPVDLPEVYDDFPIAGLSSPGRAKVSQAAQSFDWDVKKGKGSSGATVTYQGRAPAEFEVAFYLWLPEHFSAWKTYSAVLTKGQADSKNIAALDVSHPYLAQLGIKSVVVKSVGQLEPQRDGDTLHVATVKFIEYVKPKASGGTPDGSTANAGKDGKDWVQETKKSQLEKDIDAELKKAEQP